MNGVNGKNYILQSKLGKSTSKIVLKIYNFFTTKFYILHTFPPSNLRLQWPSKSTNLQHKIGDFLHSTIIFWAKSTIYIYPTPPLFCFKKIMKFSDFFDEGWSKILWLNFLVLKLATTNRADRCMYQHFHPEMALP